MKAYFLELKEELDDLHFVVLKRGIPDDDKWLLKEEFRALRKDINKMVTSGSESLVPHAMRNRVQGLGSLILACTGEDDAIMSQIDSVSRKLREMTGLDLKQTGWMRSGALANTNFRLGEGLSFICGEPGNPYRERIR